MNRKPCMRYVTLLAWILFPFMAGTAPEATAQETGQTPGEDELRSRLEKLEDELRAMRESEMWRAGAAVRALRPGS